MTLPPPPRRLNPGSIAKALKRTYLYVPVRAAHTCTCNFAQAANKICSCSSLISMELSLCTVIWICASVAAVFVFYTAADSINLAICHPRTPAVGLMKFFNNQLHTDVTFRVSEEQICAHRTVLASQSRYFECLLYGPMKEGRATEITLQETPAEAFRELLKFIYSGSVTLVSLTVCYFCFAELLCIYSMRKKKVNTATLPYLI